jgi:hypothetical protein
MKKNLYVYTITNGNDELVYKHAFKSFDEAAEERKRDIENEVEDAISCGYEEEDIYVDEDFVKYGDAPENEYFYSIDEVNNPYED